MDRPRGFNDDSLVLTDSTNPAEVPGWDSLGHVNLVLSVETEFGVEFSEDEFVRFADIGGLKRILVEKLVSPSVVGRVSGRASGDDCAASRGSFRDCRDTAARRTKAAATTTTA